MQVEAITRTGTTLQQQPKSAESVDDGRKALKEGQSDLLESGAPDTKGVQPEEILHQIKALKDASIYSLLILFLTFVGMEFANGLGISEMQFGSGISRGRPSGSRSVGAAPSTGGRHRAHQPCSSAASPPGAGPRHPEREYGPEHRMVASTRTWAMHTGILTMPREDVTFWNVLSPSPSVSMALSTAR